MNEQIYTLGVWRVKQGRESEFVRAWKELGAISGKGSVADVAAMRADSRAQAGISKLRELCTEATPGTYRVVAESP